MPSAPSFPIVGSMREAIEIMAELPVPTPEIHTYPLNRVARRVLAQDFHAPFPVPGFYRSRLDGYAVRSEDLAHASPSNPATLRVIASVPAGTWPVPEVAQGQCVRIMAGAPVPVGADAVVGFEQTGENRDGQVRFSSTVISGQAIGQPDIDAKKGELLLRRGTRLLPVHMGRLAAIGTTNVSVFARPRVAVLSTGSELLLSGMPPSPGKIYNTNQSVICGILARHSAIALPCGIARDDPEAIANTMALAVQDNTMLITTGGVGYGDHDCIRQAMRMAGAEIIIGNGSFRPGGNLALARLNGTYILALSGAQGSAVLALTLLGIPLLRRLSGDKDWRVREIDVILAEAPERVPHGLLPGQLILEGGKALFRPLSMLDLERRLTDVVIELKGDEDLQAMTRDQSVLKAYWLRGKA